VLVMSWKTDKIIALSSWEADMRYAVLLVSLLCLGFSIGALAAGTNEGAFARDGSGSRALALGGAFVAIADDASAGYWNPAGLGYLDGYHLGGMSVLGGRFGISDIKYQALSLLARPVQTGSLSGLGVGITWLNHVVSGIPYTGDGDGGTFSDDQSLFLMSVALPFAVGEEWGMSVGANLKYYRHTLLTGVGSGLGADLGILLRGSIKDIPVSIGVVSMDTLETTVSWTGTEHNPENYVPWIIKGGVSTVLADGILRLSADIDYSPSPLHGDFPRYSHLDRVHLGIEVLPVPQLALRGGLIIWRDGTKRLSAGVGISPWEGAIIDYAYVKEGADDLGGDTHILSAEFSFSTSGG